MRCPKCNSRYAAKGKGSGRSTCYSCGHNDLTSLFLEVGDVIASDDINLFRVNNSELTYEEVLAANIPDKNAGQIPAMDKGEKYRKVITGRAANTGAITEYESVIVDVYDVLVAFKVTCPATQHAVKRLLAMGQRGHKDKMTDLKEAHWQLERAMQLEENRNV